MFPHIGNNNPNWLSYFSVRLKPPTSIYIYTVYIYIHGCWDAHCIEGDLTGLSHPMIQDVRICLNPRIWVPLGSHWLIIRFPIWARIPCGGSISSSTFSRKRSILQTSGSVLGWNGQVPWDLGNWVAGLATMYTDSLKSGLTKVFGSAVLLQPERFQCRLWGATKRAANC